MIMKDISFEKPCCWNVPKLKINIKPTRNYQFCEFWAGLPIWTVQKCHAVSVHALPKISNANVKNNFHVNRHYMLLSTVTKTTVIGQKFTKISPLLWFWRTISVKKSNFLEAKHTEVPILSQFQHFKHITSWFTMQFLTQIKLVLLMELPFKCHWSRVSQMFYHR